MFSDRDLALMKTAQEEALPSTVDILRHTNADDGFGGIVPGQFVTVASGVEARIAPAVQYRGLGQLARPVDVQNYTVRLPVGTEVRKDDVIRTANYDDLRVEGIKAPASWDTVLTIQAVIVE